MSAYTVVGYLLILLFVLFIIYTVISKIRHVPSFLASDDTLRFITL